MIIKKIVHIALSECIYKFDCPLSLTNLITILRVCRLAFGCAQLQLWSQKFKIKLCINMNYGKYEMCKSYHEIDWKVVLLNSKWCILMRVSNVFLVECKFNKMLNTSKHFIKKWFIRRKWVSWIAQSIKKFSFNFNKF